MPGSNIRHRSPVAKVDYVQFSSDQKFGLQVAYYLVYQIKLPSIAGNPESNECSKYMTTALLYLVLYIKKKLFVLFLE